jgi:hypothetical protein
MINRSANQQQMQLLSVVASQEVLAVSCWPYFSVKNE